MDRFWPALVAIACTLVACGGGRSPSSPTQTPPPPPPPAQNWTLAGTVTDTISGAPIGGATLTFSGRPAVTSASDGAWTLAGNGTTATRQSLVVSAAGYVTRETSVKWESAGRSGIAIDLVPEGAPFSLPFYREFVRDGFDRPASLQPTRRWTTAPNFYINTFNPKTGQPIEPAELALITSIIQATVPQITADTFNAGVIESGNASREPRQGYINITFTYEPDATYCGRAKVGANPSEMTLNYDRCSNLCGSLKIGPETVAHEIGHAMGFWHISGDGIMNTKLGRDCRRTDFSPIERLHARIMYLRPRGNLDIDKDPSDFVAATGDADAPIVFCRR